jgi:hypothetical protein
MATPNLFSLGTIWKSEVYHAPVYIQDASGNPMTGIASGDVAVTAANQSQSVLQAITPTGWTDLGNGLYDVQIPLMEQATEGRYTLRVSATGAIPFIGAGSVERRLDQYKCHATPSYNYETQSLEIVSWLECNGQLVVCASPDTSRVVVKEDGVTVRADTTGVLPTGGDGFFVATLASIVLNPLKNHSVVVTVVHDGVTYTSGESFFTLA